MASMLKNSHGKIWNLLLTDANMLVFIEQDARGGMLQISHRFVAANNELCPSYDPSQDKSHIMYWDANTLYGWSVLQHLPHGGFLWVTPEEFKTEKVLELRNDALVGYIFEVDLEYPSSIHQLHNEFTLAPEKISDRRNVVPICKVLYIRGLKVFQNLSRIYTSLNIFVIIEI